MGAVVNAGKKVIEGMLKMAGDSIDDPPERADNVLERAESFRTASKTFKTALTTLGQAHPGQGWEGGTASRAYDERNRDQETRVLILSDTDRDIAPIVNREADQVRHLRQILRIKHKWLDDIGEVTRPLPLLPRGKQLQYAIESLHVATAIGECWRAMSQMHSDASANAAAIRLLRDEYHRVASRVVISDSSNDFDPRGSGPR